MLPKVHHSLYEGVWQWHRWMFKEKKALHIGVTHIEHKESVVVDKGMKSLIVTHFQLHKLGIQGKHWYLDLII